MQLHPGVLVEGVVVGAQAVGGLEGAAGLLGIAFLQGGVAQAQQLLGLPGLLLLEAGLVLQVGLERRRLEAGRLACASCSCRVPPVRELPFLAQVDLPGDVLQGQIELRAPAAPGPATAAPGRPIWLE